MRLLREKTILINIKDFYTEVNMHYTTYESYDRPYIRPCPIKNKEDYVRDIITLERIMFEQDKTYSYNEFLHEYWSILYFKPW